MGCTYGIMLVVGTYSMSMKGLGVSVETVVASIHSTESSRNRESMMEGRDRKRLIYSERERERERERETVVG